MKERKGDEREGRRMSGEKTLSRTDTSVLPVAAFTLKLGCVACDLFSLCASQLTCICVTLCVCVHIVLCQFPFP